MVIASALHALFELHASGWLLANDTSGQPDPLGNTSSSTKRPPSNDDGEFLCTIERGCLGKDVNGVLLGVGGDDERVVRGGEGCISRAV